MPRVLNKHKDRVFSNAIYIGRPSKWGNPFPLNKDGSNREEVVEKYIAYILSNDRLLADLHELKDKDLLCYCSPKLCHGDVLLELANQLS